MRTLWLTAIALAAPALVAAQQDPVVGNWRGSLKSSAGTESAIVLTIAKTGDRYFGSTNGVSEGADVALTKVEVAGSSITFEATSESRLGAVLLTGTVLADGNRMMGEAVLGLGTQRFPVTLTMQRRLRSDVVQKQVEQTPAYFVGRWKMDYVGGEFPPLSIGNRQGELTLAQAGVSNFVQGTLKGESFGTPFEERLTLGVDPDVDMLVLSEKRADGTEMLSLGNWRSPLAVVFVTSPVTSNGRTYQIKRVFSILSDRSFDVSEEFSVDGGPFRRLGTGRYTKQ